MYILHIHILNAGKSRSSGAPGFGETGCFSVKEGDIGMQHRGLDQLKNANFERVSSGDRSVLLHSLYENGYVRTCAA